MTSPLFRSNNPFLRETHFVRRPSRQEARYRYAPEHELIFLQDEWDKAEEHRRTVEAERAKHEERIAKKLAAEEQAQKAREEAVINREFERRYVAAGGDPAHFAKDLPELRREHAKRAALGLAQPISSVEITKEQLRQARAGANLGAAD